MIIKRDTKMTACLNPQSRFLLFVNLHQFEGINEAISEFTDYGNVVFIRPIEKQKRLMVCIDDASQAAQLQKVYHNIRGAVLVEERFRKSNLEVYGSDN
jgi:hypothetical protein